MRRAYRLLMAALVPGQSPLPPDVCCRLHLLAPPLALNIPCRCHSHMGPTGLFLGIQLLQYAAATLGLHRVLPRCAQGPVVNEWANI